MSFLEPEIAKLEGRKVAWWRLSTLLLLSSATVILVNYFGVLLVTSILLGPASIALTISRSPWQAMMSASLISLLTLMSGTLVTTFWFDCPTSCFVALENFLFLIFFFYSPLSRHTRSEVPAR